MSKRVAVLVKTIEQVNDNYGGHVERLVLSQSLNGVMLTNTQDVVTDTKGSALQIINWLKVHREITDPLNMVLTIEGKNYKIVGVVNNIGRRFFYQLEQLTGGEIYAD